MHTLFFWWTLNTSCTLHFSATQEVALQPHRLTQNCNVCMFVIYIQQIRVTQTSTHKFCLSFGFCFLFFRVCVCVCVCVVCFCTYMCMYFCWEPKHLWEIMQGQIRLTESQHQGCIPAALFENPTQKVSHIDKWIQTCECMLPTEQCVMNSLFTFCSYNWEFSHSVSLLNQRVSVVLQSWTFKING